LSIKKKNLETVGQREHYLLSWDLVAFFVTPASSNLSKMPSSKVCWSAGQPGALLPGPAEASDQLKQCRTPSMFVLRQMEFMPWEPFAQFMRKADNFQMPEDRRWLEPGERAAELS